MEPEAVFRLALAELKDHERSVIATAVSWAEAELNPNAVGDKGLANEKWGPSIGLWQIRSLHADKGTGRERDADRLKDPAFNAKAMAVISKGGTDWTPWSVYKNGSYRKHLDDVRRAVGAGGTTVATIRGGKVRPHVQAFADAVSKATGADSFGTYPGHSPSIDRAIDIFTPTNSATLGNAICQFALDNWKRYGVRYMIYRQRIHWGPGTSWKQMEDRGDLTQNHFDHAHISFEPVGGDVPAPPKPKPPTKGKRMFLFWHEGSIFLAVPPYRSPEGLSGPNVDELAAQGTPVLGVTRKAESNQFFNELKPWL